MSWFKQMTTGKDNVTIDIHRVGLMVGLAVFFIGAGASIYRGTWDMVAYGGALGSILALSGVGIKVKETTEPEAKAE